MSAWFSYDPSSPNGRFPAQPGPAAAIAQPSTLPRGLAFACAGVGGVAVITGLVMYSTTFEDVAIPSAIGSIRRTEAAAG